MLLVHVSCLEQMSQGGGVHCSGAEVGAESLAVFVSHHDKRMQWGLHLGGEQTQTDFSGGGHRAFG